jgi:hypothetical protein
MTPALERLSELVRQAEAKTRARKIEAEAQQAAEQFRAAELRARKAVEKQRVVRPSSLRAIEQADADEQLLKDLVRKLALYKASLGSEADAERLIAASQTEIERSRRQSRLDLEEIGRDIEDARRELRTATDQYRVLRRELERLQPELVAQFATDDRLLWDAESHFPGGQLQMLAQEIEAGYTAFGSLGKHEQYARLKVWIGRFRLYQASQDRETELNEELQALSHRVFHNLKVLSRQYEPGYIEAFRQDYSTDWPAYVAEAQEQLLQAVETSRRLRDSDSTSLRGRSREPIVERTAALGTSPITQGSVATASATVPVSPGVRPACSLATGAAPCPSFSCLAQLKALIGRANFPEEGLDEFLEVLREAVEEVGAEHPDLIDLVWPYRRFISGDDGLATLFRQVERLEAHQEESPSHEVP